ncbi:MAG: fatty-acid synthase, partial [bacterium]|nr:fatty-acid synthase [bacterium]
LRLNYGTRNLYVDLGAENLLAAEKEHRLIAVGVKSFAGESDMHDLEMALGQFVLYRGVLAQVDPERTLYLAIPSFAFDDVFADQFGNW